ncbi:hypothetical protein ACFSUD_02495 [Sulfitobacter aestuarii]|uniref:Periplasmic protein n=1 Tax=Sulfitobacter aestuarii TaxID=2161676 RepID=A0ABW5U0H2_9RHOB
MSTPERPTRRSLVSRVLSGVLILQLLLGLLLFWGDLRSGLRLPSFAPKAPSLTEPVRPGDQTRRFDPDRASPGGRPMPETPLPDRLILTSLEAGASALLEGTIAGGDAERIIKQFDALQSPPKTLLINSPGGSVQDALTLGRHLREAGVDTALRENDICYSACPYLLAAGVGREVPESASVGVHQHYFGENTLLPAFVAVADIQRGQGEVMGYLEEMGIDLRLMRHALMTPPEQIYLLLPEELRAYRLISARE